MRQCCIDVARYGDTSCPTNVKPRHVTVILNPAAKKRFSQNFNIDIETLFLAIISFFFSEKPKSYLRNTASLYCI